jgi:hypothetical protein
MSTESSWPTTLYFREQVLRKRPYLRMEWCLAILHSPDGHEVQTDGRVRFWGYVADYPGKAIRVVTLSDRITLHNAFPDSAYTKRNP